jgi:hypothetical protein
MCRNFDDLKMFHDQTTKIYNFKIFSFSQPSSKLAVPNLFINWANIQDKKSWWAYFRLENKNMS